MRHIALNIRCVHHPFSANGWQQRNWDGEKKKHFELKRSNNYYWHNKHLYMYMDVTPQR